MRGREEMGNQYRRSAGFAVLICEVTEGEKRGKHFIFPRFSTEKNNVEFWPGCRFYFD